MAMLNQQLQHSGELLAQERDQVQAILQSIREGVVVTDLAGRIRACNVALLQLTGEPSESLVGQPVERLFVAEEGGAAGLSSALLQQRMQQIHERNQKQFKLLLQEAPIALMVVERTAQGGQVSLVSHGLEQLLGYPSGALCNRPLLELIPPPEHAPLLQLIDRLGGEQRVVEPHTCNWIQSGGTTLESRLSLLLIEGGNGGRRYSRVLLRVHAEAEISAELLRMTPFGAVVEKQEESAWVSRQLSNSSGGQIPVSVSSALLHKQNRRLDGVVLVLSDERERIHAEQREQYAAFQAGVAEMSVNILHNVGNTIQGMDGCSYELGTQFNMLEQINTLYDTFVEQLQQAEAEGGESLVEAER